MSRIGRALRLVAAAGLGLAGLAIGAIGAIGTAPAASASPSHVAIVIAGDKTACVPWTSGMTGDDVLNRVATVHYRQDGIIDAIDSFPNPPHADTSNFWAYWHNTGSGWVFSSLGASSYQPKAGTVEGWAYGNQIKPAATSYGSVCHDSAPPPPPPPPVSRTPTAHPPSTTHVPAPTSEAANSQVPASTSRGAAGVGSGTTAAAAPTTPQRCPTSSPKATPTAPRVTPSRSPTKSPTPTPRCPAISHMASPLAVPRPSTVDGRGEALRLPDPSTSPVAADKKKAGDGSSAAPTVGAAIGLAAAAAIGGVAFWRLRRQGGG